MGGSVKYSNFKNFISGPLLILTIIFFARFNSSAFALSEGLFNQDIGKTADTITKVESASPGLLLVCDCMHSVAKDRIFLNKLKNELEKKGKSALVCKYHSIANNHILAIKNCPKGFWIVYGACLCSGTWRDLDIGINRGYLKSAWKKNDIKGLVFLNLSSYNLKKLKYLKRAWDDNFSPQSFKGIDNPYQYLINAGFKVAESPMYNKYVIDERRIPYLADEIIKAVGGAAPAASTSGIFKDSSLSENTSGVIDIGIRAQFASENGELGNVSGGPASLGMIMEYYGVNKSTPALAKLCGTRPVAGTGFNEMAGVARTFGFDKSYVTTGRGINWLDDITAAGKPVIVHVDTKGFWPQGHYMVATGVKNGKVFVADPWTGHTASYSIAQFKTIWAARQSRAIVIEKSGPAAISSAVSAAKKVPAAPADKPSTAGPVKKTDPETNVANQPVKSGIVLNVPARAQRAAANGPLGKVMCGPVSLGMIMEYYGVDRSSKTLADLCGTGLNGTGFNEMAAVAKKLGFGGSYVATGKTVDFLKKMTAGGAPVLVHVDTQGYWGPGHYMVATGVKDGRVYLNDPWRGGQRSYTIAQFNAQWSSRANRVVVVKR
jgi:predicted double-glycine peptidase